MALKKPPADTRAPAIKVARFAGFCSGVTIAVKKTKKLLLHKKVYCIGDLVHNSFVMSDLAKKGLIIVKKPTAIPENSDVIIRAHGLPLKTIKNLKKKNCRIFDFTCPILKKIHLTLEKLKKADYSIIIIGNPLHAEVKALISHAGRNSVIVENKAAAENFKPQPARSPKKKKTAVICQSTITDSRFLEISGVLGGKIPGARIINTICREAKERRVEAKELAKISKMVIIVGDRKSSNTVNLAKIVRRICPAEIITGVNDLRGKKFRDPIGITSGASSPRELVLEIEKCVYKKVVR
ncbi:MAG: 4-hydroxy-3-methylbut-2-enyl diphosphate reductase [bacterium]